VLLAHFIYQNDRLSYNKTLGCILGFAGVMAVNVSNGLDFSFNGGSSAVKIQHIAIPNHLLLDFIDRLPLPFHKMPLYPGFSAA
ncbi:hypothetical protein ONO57_26730, partial [Salmonella enterica subsp. enterica serovar Anatum]|nr:hypothetical protein [Salmonella enterica subsp. enterica serovar Anatum]